MIARCKYAVIQDIAGGSDLDKYCLPKWFHQGIGALDHDGGREENFFYLRKTGRYPAIPVVAEFAGDMAKKFKYVRNQFGDHKTPGPIHRTRLVNSTVCSPANTPAISLPDVMRTLG